VDDRFEGPGRQLAPQPDAARDGLDRPVIGGGQRLVRLRDQLMNAERGLIPEFGPRSTFSGG